MTTHTALEARNSESRCGQGCAPSGGPGVGTRLPLPAVGAPDSPCLRLHLSIPACFFTWPPLLCLCVLSSHENMSRWIYLKKKHSNFTYLFICGCAGSLLPCWLFTSFGEQGLLSGCVAQASHCGGFFCSRAWALGCTGFHRCSSIALECRLSSCGARA